jgi:hypothetical protein
MDIQDLFPIAITFVAIGVLLSFGLSVQTDIRDDFAGFANCGQNSSGGTSVKIYTACGYDYNASQNSVVASSNLSGKLPVLGTILIAAIVVGVLIKAFVMK